MEDSHQLIERSCFGVKPDRPPIFDIFCNDAVVEHFAGRRPCAGDTNTMIAAAAAGLDGTRYVAPPNVEGSTYTDIAGSVRENMRWTSWVKIHAHQDADSWARWLAGHVEQLESEPDPTERQIADEKQRQRALNGQLGGTVFIHCTLSTAINMALFGYQCGLESFTFLWEDRRDLVRRWFAALEAAQHRQIRLAAHRETSPLAMIYSDIAYHQHLMFSPSMLREIGFYEDVARICAAIHERGMIVIFHSDGYIMPIMDDLIAAGIDGVNPIEVAAGMDIFELRRCHPQLILVGGVDVTHLLVNGPARDIRGHTRRMIDEVGAEGRLLIGSSTEVGNDVPLANYLAFHDEAMRG